MIYWDKRNENGMSKRKKVGIIVGCVIAVVVGIVIALHAPEQVEPEYTGWIDVSKPSYNYLEYSLAIGETLYGKLVVHTGNVVFVVSDYWHHHLHDLVVKAGEEYSFSITAQQTGERYRCSFTFLEGEADLPRSARFYHNMTPKPGM
jgi:hypothetical protein